MNSAPDQKGYASCAKLEGVEKYVCRRFAWELHEKVGVKKDIERLEREIKNAAAAGAKEGDGSS
ncbi:hypothetical protein [Cupriavidus nantongensis]|uniref:hypothetical protein n=1 Tax=Cupriavidus nantongensis TaxID=1796606 RepID=UPI002247D8CD|nr:hypothetical protein [Cupriavidus nantongensis]